MDIQLFQNLTEKFKGGSLDFDYLVAMHDLETESDIEFLMSLFDLFLKVSPTRLADINAGLIDQDLEPIKTSLHTLKSSCGNIGALKLQTLCEEFENLCTKSADLDWKTLIDKNIELQKEHQSVISEIHIVQKTQITSQKKIQ